MENQNHTDEVSSFVWFFCVKMNLKLFGIEMMASVI